MSDIQHMNLAALDLNLLVIFDALMTERNVTRAGEKVGLSQPATSNALARLRHVLQDELFTRTATGLRPTPTAIALYQDLRPALQQIQATLLEPAIFDPASSDRVFTIGLSDYVEFCLLPTLMNRLQSLAPGIILQVRTGDRKKMLSLLDTGDLDLICGVFPEEISHHQAETLLDETYVCVCRQQHPMIHPHLGQSLSLDTYLAASHLLVSIKEDRIGRVDTLLAERNLSRKIHLSTPHFLTVPFILAQTDLVATLPRRVALSFARHQQLQLLPPPLPLPGFSVAMRWHRSSETAPACQWLRSVVLETARNLPAHLPEPES